MPLPCSRPSSAKPGTATGTDAATSTTARPWDRSSGDECRIDSIAQSWAVISGAAEHERAVRAMSAVDRQLVGRSDRLVKLFTPAFDRNPARTPATSRPIRPASAKMAASTLTRPCGRTWRFALLGDGDRAGELFSILNPINHASTREGVHRYKVEPYVVCADVYSSPELVGRGGWTWYTGSAGWMYRTAVEGILGLRFARRNSIHRSLHSTRLDGL